MVWAGAMERVGAGHREVPAASAGMTEVGRANTPYSGAMGMGVPAVRPPSMTNSAPVL